MTRDQYSDTTDFLSFVSSLTYLDNGVRTALKSKLYQKEYKNGELILGTGTVCKRFYFVDRGLVKTFFYSDTREFIMRFSQEGNVFTVLNSFILQKPSTHSVLAIEDTLLTCLDHDDLESLCRQHHAMETFYRKLVSLATINMMERIEGTLEEKAQIAYNRFLRDYGSLMQRISLSDLACYLGITQVSLSRIRAIR